MAARDRRLIVNADDYNLTAGVGRGICKAHEHGIVTSTSLIMTQPLSQRDLRWLKSATGLSVGLHLCLDVGKLLSVVARQALGRVTGAARRELLASPGLDRDVVSAELEAQFESFVGGLGRQPTHLDTHHDIHSNPVVLDVLVELARRFGIPVRSLDDGTRRKIRAAGLPTPDATVGGQGCGAFWTVERLKEALAKLEPGITEFVCHGGLGIPDHDLPTHGIQREEELKSFLCPGLASILAESKVLLIGYKDLPCTRGGAGRPAESGRSGRPR
ncbi:MAG: ChbG/HpnK family deacetylase [Candidatus Riflebacteria bacterium]|nr:ChbG/HpnK family deacetylase [Candidatus Riflebacteria bacterium]